RGQAVADGAPVPAEVTGRPHTAGADRGEQALVHRVVVEAVHTAGQLVDALAVHAVEPMIGGDQRPVAVRAPSSPGAGNGDRVRNQAVALVDGRPVGAERYVRPGRRQHGRPLRREAGDLVEWLGVTV